MFENKLSSQGIHYSRYIASWIRSGGKFKGELIKDESGNLIDVRWLGKFRSWLRSIGLSEEEVVEIAEIAGNGKLELEESAKSFLKG